MKVTEETTDQEIFDHVAKHLLKQGRQSRDPDTGECRYRGPDGTMCAVGCLIPDGEYTPALEGKSALDLFSTPPAGRGYLPTDHPLCSRMGLLDDLQCLHDYSYPDTWVSGLERLAETRDLTFHGGLDE